jgi:hypothetical protein
MSQRPGRPPIVPGESTEVLHVRVADSDHDGVCRLAILWERKHRRRVSKADVIREAVRRLLEAEATL